MKDKMKSIINGVIISSIIFIIIGLYYLIIESGIPYQDAPMELLIKYEANQTVGEICLCFGIGLLIFWVILKVIVMLIKKRNR